MHMDFTPTVRSSVEQPRVARQPTSACDTCRRRRVKCDGNQPCERCVRSDVACTYGSIANRTSAVSYARHLERKVAELQALLRDRPQTESSEQAAIVSDSEESARQQVVDMFIGPGDDYVYRLPQSSVDVFYGRFAGLRILRALGTHRNRESMAVDASSPGRELVEALESSTLSPPPAMHAGMYCILPSRQQVQDLTNHAMRTALIGHDCLDHGEFSGRLARLYTVDPDDYSLDDRRFLAVVYGLLALGRRYGPASADDEIDETSDKVKVKGLSYFHASDQMLKIIEYPGLDSIRATILQARFLISACLISKAYSRLCVGIAAALRLGLHVSSSAVRRGFSKDELFQRRRVFATLNMMDTYLSSLLGMPKILKEADTEQTLGLQDEDLADEGKNFVLRHPTAPAVEAVLDQKLYNIIAKVLEARYPLNDGSMHKSAGPYEEDFDFLATQEAEMEKWHNGLMELPEGPSDIRTLQAQLTLRLHYSLAQLVLYRPFLHHLARDKQDPKFNIRGYECGSASVRAAMQAVWVVEAFETNGILYEACWSNIYVLGFAAGILTFFITCATQRTTIRESTAAAWKTKRLLGLLARYSLPALRCFRSLSAILDELQEFREDDGLDD